MRKLYSHVLNKYVLSSCFLVPLFFSRAYTSTAANDNAANSIGYAGLTATRYTVMVVGTSGDVTSPPAVLTFKNPTTITVSLENQGMCSGSHIIFTATAAGTNLLFQSYNYFVTSKQRS